MQSKDSNLVAEKAIEIIEEVLDITLSNDDQDWVRKLEENQDLFHESIYKIDETRNEYTIALEAIFYLFIYDFNAKDIKVYVDKNLLTRLEKYLYTSADSILIQRTEVICYFMRYLDHEFQ